MEFGQWDKWLIKLQQGDANSCEDAELLVTTLNICAGHTGLNEDILSRHEYKALSNLTNKICRHLSQVQSKKVSYRTTSFKFDNFCIPYVCTSYFAFAWDQTQDLEDRKATIFGLKEVKHDMQALVKLVLEESGGLNRNIKQVFLCVVKFITIVHIMTQKPSCPHIQSTL